MCEGQVHEFVIPTVCNGSLVTDIPKLWKNRLSTHRALQSVELIGQKPIIIGNNVE